MLTPGTGLRGRVWLVPMHTSYCLWKSRVNTRKEIIPILLSWAEKSCNLVTFRAFEHGRCFAARETCRPACGRRAVHEQDLDGISGDQGVTRACSNGLNDVELNIMY